MGLRMRGDHALQEGLFNFSRLNDFVPADHPLRPMEDLVNESLKRLNGLFSSIGGDTGRGSVAPRSGCERCCCRCSSSCGACVS